MALVSQRVREGTNPKRSQDSRRGVGLFLSRKAWSQRQEITNLHSYRQGCGRAWGLLPQRASPEGRDREPGDESDPSSGRADSHVQDKRLYHLSCWRQVHLGPPPTELWGPTHPLHYSGPISASLLAFAAQSSRPTIISLWVRDRDLAFLTTSTKSSESFPPCSNRNHRCDPGL